KGGGPGGSGPPLGVVRKHKRGQRGQSLGSISPPRGVMTAFQELALVVFGTALTLPSNMATLMKREVGWPNVTVVKGSCGLYCRSLLGWAQTTGIRPSSTIITVLLVPSVMSVMRGPRRTGWFLLSRVSEAAA